MGACMDCFTGSSEGLEQPDDEERRAQQAAAAEKRVKEAEGRGVKDPEGVKKRKLQQEEMEKRAEALEQTEGDNKLKWQVG